MPIRMSQEKQERLPTDPLLTRLVFQRQVRLI
jgi:hypothetical protein